MEDPDSEAPTLLAIPEDSLREILKRVDYCGIASLRKTCHTLRNFIDDSKWEPSAISFNIFMMSYQILFSVKFPNSELRLSYRDEFGDCSILQSMRNPSSEPETEDDPEPEPDLEHEPKHVVLKTRSHVDAFLDDLKALLKFTESQNKPMNSIHFLNRSKRPSNFFEEIEKLDIHLKIERMNFTVYEESEARALLNLASPGILNTILMEYSAQGNCTLEMAEISRMQQWRQAEHVRINKYVVWGPADFLHFRSVDAYFVDLSSEDAVLMKETFLNSPNFESFKYHYSQLEDGVFDALGANPAIGEEDDYGPKRIWCFRSPGNPEKGLLVESTELNNLMCYTSVNLRDVPENVEILG